MKRGFTLIELMIVILIIGILAAVAMSALANAAETARAQRTRAIITKLDQLISEKYESFRTRAVPVQSPAGSTPIVAARLRLNAIRELMRMELPDNVNDVWDAPVVLNNVPAVTLGYRRVALPIGTWTGQYEEAEALYLVVSRMKEGDKIALDYFAPSEIGDVDGDGMKEILDGWGEPIHFLRWAPGYRKDTTPAALTSQERSQLSPDPFDPLKVDPRVSPPNTDKTDDTFTLKPLIWSAGPDKLSGISVGSPTDIYSASSPPNDPFISSCSIGSITDNSLLGDNITNHYIQP